MTRKISLVAACWSCASALSLSASAFPLRASVKRFSRSRSGGLASLDFAGFGPRRIGLPLPPYESAGDRLGEWAHVSKWARRLFQGADMRPIQPSEVQE